MDLSKYKNTDYRYDIQGVRAVGALLIMIYHIWVGKVSGGVDVFFVVSGYFMAGMLVRSYVRDGQLRPFQFWGRVIKRIAPLAYIVILATLVLGFFFSPPYLWWNGLRDALFSSVHMENWWLMHTSTDYLASEEPSSPFQQFWALSIQIQFYFILPFIFFIAFYISKKLGSLKPIFIVFSLIALLSLGFSVYYTQVSPVKAYFHVGTRLWEFLTGVLVFLVMPYINIGPRQSRIMMLLGFIMLIGTGVFISENIRFPGYVALLPVIAAVIIIISGKNSNKGYVYQILSSRTLVYLGNISFSVYLWHWPILTYYQIYTGLNKTDMGILDGILIIIISIILSILTFKMVEKPFKDMQVNNKLVPYLVGIFFFLPVLSISLGSYYLITKIFFKEDFVNGNYFNGSAAYVQGGPTNISKARMTGIPYDLTNVSRKACGKGVINGEIQSCVSGDINSDKTVMLVGGSRLAHWEPFYDYLGKKEEFKVISAVINGCSFGFNGSESGANESCEEWNKIIGDYVLTVQPDLVVMNSSRQLPVGGKLKSGKLLKEFVPQGYSRNIEMLTSHGIPVVGIRVIPRYNDPNRCLWKSSSDVSVCVTEVNNSLAEKNPITEIKNKTNNFYPVDFTNVLCQDGRCPSEFEGYPVMRDGGHLTKSYVMYMSQSLEASQNRQLGVETISDILEQDKYK